MNKPNFITLVLAIVLLPVFTYAQNPFNCNYEVLENFASKMNNPSDSLIAMMIDSYTENCLQNDLEYSRWANELIFQAMADKIVFDKIISSLNYIAEDKYHLLLKYILLRPISENYDYEAIIKHIRNRRRICNSELINSTLESMEYKYVSSIK